MQCSQNVAGKKKQLKPNRNKDAQKSWVTGDIFVASPGSGVLSAWEPWEFTRWILFELQNSEIDEEHPEWRLSWVSGVATLRTVGHVLSKVDSKKSDLISNVVRLHWKNWQSQKTITGFSLIS